MLPSAATPDAPPADPDVGRWSPVSDGSIPPYFHGHEYRRRGEPGYARRALAHQQLSTVTAAVLMFRRAIYEEVGGMDERLELAFNDVDFACG